jgi:hypothetical protein
MYFSPWDMSQTDKSEDGLTHQLRACKLSRICVLTSLDVQGMKLLMLLFS